MGVPELSLAIEVRGGAKGRVANVRCPEFDTLSFQQRVSVPGGGGGVQYNRKHGTELKPCSSQRGGTSHPPPAWPCVLSH